MGMEQAWLIPAIPAATAAILILFGKYLPRKGDWLSVLAISASFVVFIFVLKDLTSALAGGGQFSAVHSGHQWVKFDSFELRIGFQVDQLAAVMVAVVSFISLMVQVYSLGYMKGDKRYGWYFAVQSLFAAAMLTLVLADNFLLLYFAWEGVGLCSFLLIGHYHERRSAAEAAKKAFITTRLGDVGLLIGIILLYRSVGTFDMQTIFNAARNGQIDHAYLTASVLLILLGAMGKSAQFPFHVWLPDAMEGPTPVSALIHAATMVVAGVYLVARTMPLFQEVPNTLIAVTGVGLITTFMSATMGLVMTDIKRVVAYSTLNSLGLMFIALGAGSVTVALLYVFTHAFFKALLFLSSGSVYHATDELEVTKMGGLARKMPVTATVFTLGAMSMAGLFPLAGFWNKDELLLTTFENHNFFIYLLVLASVLITALYMTRLVLLVFTGKPRDEHVYEHAHEPGLAMRLPLLLLSVLTVFAGFVVFTGVGKLMGFPGGFGQFLFTTAPEAFRINAGVTASSIILVLLGIAGGYYIWSGTAERAKVAGEAAPQLYTLFRNKYYMDDAYQWAINHVVLVVAGIVSWYDRAVVNDTGVNGPADVTRFGGFLLKFHETGKMPNYALLMAAGVVVLAIAALIVGT
ncbi:MAG: NADH-quinone oxidoreductase subunit L [Dehalococcoidia bacterium]|jgi:NADH-quinone oxidoreductase subunit L